MNRPPGPRGLFSGIRMGLRLKNQPLEFLADLQEAGEHEHPAKNDDGCDRRRAVVDDCGGSEHQHRDASKDDPGSCAFLALAAGERYPWDAGGWDKIRAYNKLDIVI